MPKNPRNVEPEAANVAPAEEGEHTEVAASDLQLGKRPAAPRPSDFEQPPPPPPTKQ